jgi:hypothetical protein
MFSAGSVEQSFPGWGLYGAFRQIQDLKQGPVKGDQILLYKAVSSFYIVIYTELEIGADQVIGIERQAVTI